MKPSCKLLKYWIKDEKKAEADYKKYSLPNLSKDEGSHKKFLTKKYNRECN